MRGAILLVSTIVAVAATGAVAQDITIGAREFANSCAQCHGIDGRGDGYLAGFLNAEAPDLTMVQKNNGGVFPVSAVYAIIEGSAPAGVHGDSDMPAWGDRYSADANTQLGMEFTAADRDAFVRARILALIEYVASIQAE